ncbi:MAG: acyl-CoA dehydrogenase family protein, partial [Geminicoccaceae bacterium]
MDLRFTAEDQAFRTELRAFLAEVLPKALTEKVRLGQRLEKEDYEFWHARLSERGWLATSWPKRFGGAEWDAVKRYIFEEECALAHA